MEALRYVVLIRNPLEVMGLLKTGVRAGGIGEKAVFVATWGCD